MRSKPLVFGIVWLAMVSGARATDYLPFTEGIIYEYERIPEHLGRFTIYFSGTADIGGSTTRVQHESDGLRTFWTETAEGDKLLHAVGFGLEPPVVYSPAVLVIDQPLYVGKVWEQVSEDSEGITHRFRKEVMAFGEVAVPAGVFQAFTIRQTVEWPEARRTHKRGRPVRWVGGPTDTGESVSDVTYADGIGLILTVFGSRRDELLSWRTVAVESSTWTRIRMLYR